MRLQKLPTEKELLPIFEEIASSNSRREAYKGFRALAKLKCMRAFHDIPASWSYTKLHVLDMHLHRLMKAYEEEYLDLGANSPICTLNKKYEYVIPGVSSNLNQVLSASEQRELVRQIRFVASVNTKPAMQKLAEEMMHSFQQGLKEYVYQLLFICLMQAQEIPVTESNNHTTQLRMRALLDEFNAYITSSAARKSKRVRNNLEAHIFTKARNSLGRAYAQAFSYALRCSIKSYYVRDEHTCSWVQYKLSTTGIPTEKEIENFLQECSSTKDYEEITFHMDVNSVLTCNKLVNKEPIPSFSTITVTPSQAKNLIVTVQNRVYAYAIMRSLDTLKAELGAQQFYDYAIEYIEALKFNLEVDDISNLKYDHWTDLLENVRCLHS